MIFYSGFLQQKYLNIRSFLSPLTTNLQHLSLTQFPDHPLLRWFLLKDILRSFPFALFYTFLLFILCVHFFFRKTKKISHEELVAIRKVLHALLAVVNPTRSTWHSAYLTAARHTALKKKSCVDVPLKALLDDIMAGRMEFRSPRLNLPDLLKSTFTAHDYVIRLCLNITQRIYIIEWLAFAQLSVFKPYVSGHRYHSF